MEVNNGKESDNMEEKLKNKVIKSVEFDMKKSPIEGSLKPKYLKST